MKRFLGTFFCIAAISWAVFYGVSVPHDPLARATDGVIDLSGAGPEGGVYTLGGEWEFYWAELYEPKDFAGQAPEKTFIPVPSSWNKHGYPRLGYATYRFTLLAPPKARLMLYVPEILSSSTVWVNGEKVFSAGRVGTGPEIFQASAKSAMLSLPSANGVYEIVLQAANYQMINGGLRHPFRVGLGGLENPLIASFFGQWLLLAGLVSVFFATGFYNAAFYILRRGVQRQEKREERDLIYLLFGLHCLLTGLRFLLDQNGPAQFFFRGEIINEELRLIYLILVSLGTICVIIFSILAFELKCGRAMRLVWAAILGLPLLLLIVLPNPVSPFHAMLQILPFLLIIVLAAKSLSLARLRARPYLGLYFIALCVFFFWGAVVNAGAVSYGFAGFTLHNVFFTLAQFTMLSQEYTKARHRARELAAKNDFYHRMAHDLLTPLTIVSTSVQVAARFSEEAPDCLEKAQSEIMSMAEKINNALDEKWQSGGDA